MLELVGDLNADALSGAVRDLVTRQQVLRTIFCKDAEGVVTQRVVEVAQDLLALRDTSALPDPANDERAREIATQAADTPFDLEAAPACRFVLIRLSPRRHWLVIVAHHIVADGLSQAILLEELEALYRARVSGLCCVARADLGSVHRLCDLAAEWSAPSYLTSQVEYWQRTLSQPPAELSFPPAGKDPMVAGESGAKYEFRLDRALSLRLGALGRSCDASMFMVLLSVLKLVLARVQRRKRTSR